MQARRQSRDFASHGIAMHRAAVDRFVEHLGRQLQRFARLRLVGAGCDCFRGGLGEATSPRPDRAITLGAFETLPMTLFGRWVNRNMRHNQPYLAAPEPRSNTIVIGPNRELSASLHSIAHRSPRPTSL